jgi:hypothetical protein
MPFRLKDFGWSPVPVVVCPSPSPSREVVGPPPGAQARAGRLAASSRSSSVMTASMGRSSGSNGRGAVATGAAGRAYAGAP